MAERADASNLPPGRYSRRLGESPAAGAAAGSGGAANVGAGAGAGGSGGASASTGPAPTSGFSVRNFLSVFKYSRRALELVWSTNRFLAVVIGLLTVAAGALPAG